MKGRERGKVLATTLISRIRRLYRSDRQTTGVMLSIVVMIGLAILFAILAMSPFQDRQNHQAILTRIRSLDFNNASLQRDVLRARVGLLANYDSLVHSIVGLHDDVAALRVLFSDSEAVKIESMAHLLDDVQAAIDHDDAEVERFKTQNALLRNSLRIFSKALARLQETTMPRSDTAREVTDTLGNLMLQYLDQSDERTTRRITASLNTLSRQTSPYLPDERLVVIHGRLMLAVLPQVSAIIAEIQQSDTTVRAQRLQQEYLDIYGAASNKSQWSRVFLGATSAILCLSVIYLVSRLRKQTLILRRRLRFEGLTRDIGLHFDGADTSEATINLAMNRALEETADFFGALRCSFLLLDTRSMTVTERFGGRRETAHEETLLGELASQASASSSHTWRQTASSEELTVIRLAVQISRDVTAYCLIDFDPGRKKPTPDEAILFERAMQFLWQKLERSRDHLERVTLEKRLEHAERLQAVGTLAGGIAHEFNNILVAIVGYGEMALGLLKQKQPSPIRLYVQEIAKAADRARLIIDQILTLSRKHEATKVPIDLVEAVNDMLPLLRVPMPAAIELSADFPDATCTIEGNPVDVQRILMNLCKNAGEAIDGPGKVSITIREARLETRKILSHGLMSPGDYVVLSVQDTGKGIPQSVLPHIFEPFFTTRAKSGGTGLGLAAVHGSVEALDGKVDVTSVPGHGTTFDMFFTRSSKSPVAVAELFGKKPVPTGNGEVVVVVDADTETRTGYEDQLAALGYEPVGYKTWQDLENGLREGMKPDFILIEEDVLPKRTANSRLRDLFGETPYGLISGDPDAPRNKRFDKKNGRQMVPVLPKPVRSNVLAAALQTGIHYSD